jgi:hypothetical protein
MELDSTTRCVEEYCFTTTFGIRETSKTELDKKEISDKINNIKDNFKSSTATLSIFKNTNKLNCAKMVSDNMNIQELIKHTIFIIPNTNKIYMDYALFKTYAHDQIYDILIQYVIHLFNICIESHNSFELHIDLNTFSISAAQRYKPAIQKFCNECLSNGTDMMLHLSIFRIYNTPSMIDSISSIFRPFISDQIKNNVEFINRKDSMNHKEMLFR